ncbi:hypothetical protein KIPB_008177 [Kipferlia bialata]|uniref:Uncharacterized protein n=1 Tax=Kipferlia bialata TaxID=797122 RepID=A0A391NNE5_9EUKA|nr:hypothetical protein KIPB_008177 [Kipferlia bialata]|eukprot:g8177.t1
MGVDYEATLVFGWRVSTKGAVRWAERNGVDLSDVESERAVGPVLEASESEHSGSESDYSEEDGWAEDNKECEPTEHMPPGVCLVCTGNYYDDDADAVFWYDTVDSPPT